MTRTPILTILSHDKWLDIADYHTTPHSIENVRHLDSVDDLNLLPISGRYGTLGHEKLVVSIDTAAPVLVVGFERESQLPLADCDILWTKLDSALAQLRVRSGEYVREITYEHHRSWVDDEYDFTMSAYEDFDFGLWVFDLKNDIDLQQRMIENWRHTEFRSRFA